jgi:hypothetical protein
MVVLVLPHPTMVKPLGVQPYDEIVWACVPEHDMNCVGLPAPID